MKLRKGNRKTKHIQGESTKYQIIKIYGFKLRDIYRFKNEFEKIYLRATPKRMLPEIQRNNFLENPGLSLVKSVQNIGAICERLRKPYSGPKMMLSKKLSQLENLEIIWSVKLSIKILKELTTIIGTIKDLIQLSHRHNIKKKLYNTDSIDKIYSMDMDE